jgi:hypothetical protein
VLNVAETWYFPLKPSGTRHEYRQKPTQPYSKWAKADTSALPSTTFSPCNGAADNRGSEAARGKVSAWGRNNLLIQDFLTDAPV